MGNASMRGRFKNPMQGVKRVYLNFCTWKKGKSDIDNLKEEP